MTITYYIALACAILFIPLISGVLAWCFEQNWRSVVYTFTVVLLLIILLSAGIWGFGYLSNVPLTTSVQSITPEKP